MIDNRILEDSNLSWDARGLLAFLLSKPDKWNVNVKHLEAQSDAGKTKVRRILKELSQRGYLEYRKGKTENGQFTGTEIIIHEQRRDRFPESPQNGPIVNTELLTNTDISETKKTKTNHNRERHEKTRRLSAAERALAAERRIATPD